MDKFPTSLSSACAKPPVLFTRNYPAGAADIRRDQKVLGLLRERGVVLLRHADSTLGISAGAEEATPGATLLELYQSKRLVNGDAARAQFTPAEHTRIEGSGAFEDFRAWVFRGAEGDDDSVPWVPRPASYSHVAGSRESGRMTGDLGGTLENSTVAVSLLARSIVDHSRGVLRWLQDWTLEEREDELLRWDGQCQGRVAPYGRDIGPIGQPGPTEGRPAVWSPYAWDTETFEDMMVAYGNYSKGIFFVCIGCCPCPPLFAFS